MISTSRISVNIDTEVKRGAMRVLNEMGLDMTTAINSFLRTVVREGRIPYEFRTERAYRDSIDHEYILAELAKAEGESADPNIKWLSHEEVMANVAKRREARKRGV